MNSADDNTETGSMSDDRADAGPDINSKEKTPAAEHSGWQMSHRMARLSDEEFRRISGFIQGEFGIKLPEKKKSMVEARLRKRLRQMGLDTFEEYCEHVFDKDGDGNELQNMIDVITTNKTDFFREPKHFEYLSNNLLPELAEDKDIDSLRIWSAGCSTGEEPYTLSMVMDNYSEFDYHITATDISAEVLYKAADAIYSEERIEDIEDDIRNKYFLRSKDRSSKLVRVVSEIRERVKFMQLNLMDEEYPFEEPFDMIFFRNVMIYFERSTQERLINRFSNYLKKGGHLFIGHSETMLGIKAPFKQVTSTVYKHI
jgi:chemotaxis protein methyltransferase CheR